MVGDVSAFLAIPLALVFTGVGAIGSLLVAPGMDSFAGGFAVVTSVLVAILVETPHVNLTPTFIGVMAYLVLGNSVIAVSLMNLMIRKGEAARVTSLLYLVPGGAALMAWPILGETFSPLAMLGMVTAGVGVWLVMRRARPARLVPQPSPRDS